MKCLVRFYSGQVIQYSIFPPFQLYKIKNCTILTFLYIVFVDVVLTRSPCDKNPPDHAAIYSTQLPLPLNLIFNRIFKTKGLQRHPGRSVLDMPVKDIF